MGIENEQKQLELQQKQAQMEADYQIKSAELELKKMEYELKLQTATSSIDTNQMDSIMSAISQLHGMMKHDIKNNPQDVVDSFD
jgi:hypothetical protein